MNPVLKEQKPGWQALAVSGRSLCSLCVAAAAELNGGPSRCQTPLRQALATAWRGTSPDLDTHTTHDEDWNNDI